MANVSAMNPGGSGVKTCPTCLGSGIEPRAEKTAQTPTITTQLERARAHALSPSPGASPEPPEWATALAGTFYVSYEEERRLEAALASAHARGRDEREKEIGLERSIVCEHGHKSLDVCACLLTRKEADETEAGLRGALKHYGGHVRCDAPGGDGPCNCGLQDFLDQKPKEGT